MGGMVSTSSPSMKRIVATIESQGPLDLKAIAKLAHVDYKYLTSAIRLLLPEGKVHVSGWARVHVSGKLSPIYSAGPGESVPKPDTGYQSSRQRERRLAKADQMLAERPIEECRVTTAMLTMAGIKAPVNGHHHGL